MAAALVRGKSNGVALNDLMRCLGLFWVRVKTRSRSNVDFHPKFPAHGACDTRVMSGDEKSKALLVILGNLLSDILYGIVDPRVRLS